MKLLLIPFSYLFRIIVFFRNFLYNKGFFKEIQLDTLVISVGNIAAGGTGKTPFVELLARYILNKGKFVVVLLKGYKREHDDIKVVELGFENPKGELNSENLGDEAFVLLDNLSDVQAKGLIVVGDDKTKTAKFAATKFKPDVIIIDDGFQHRKLARDYDIVIINPNADKHLIPAGNLREPFNSIIRSDIVVINQKFGKDIPMENTKQKKKIICSYEFESYRNLNGEKTENIEGDAVAFCGIGEPGSFKKLLESNGVKITDFIKFPDHHIFTNGDIEKIIESCNRAGSKYIITTQKDFLRIKNSELVLKAQSDNIYKTLLYNYPLYYAKIKMQITQNADTLLNEIDDLIELI